MRLRLKNFKSYIDTGLIQIKPLTLVFGKNSAGKSALLQALNSLSQSTFSSRFSRPAEQSKAELAFYGETWDLGDYDRVLHKQSSSSTMGFEFGLEFLGEDARAKIHDQGLLKTKLSEIERRRIWRDMARELSLSLEFKSPGVLEAVTIKSGNAFPMTAFVRSKSTSRQPTSRFNFFPKHYEDGFSDIMLDLLRTNEKSAEAFARELLPIFKVDMRPDDDKGQNTEHTANIKKSTQRWREWEKSKNKVLASNIDTVKYDNPREFFNKCSKNEFTKFVNSLLDNPRFSRFLEKIERETSQEIIENWQLPEVHLNLTPIPQEFRTTIRQFNTRAKRNGTFALDPKYRDIFCIDHHFVIASFENLPNQAMSKYWVSRLKNIRLLAVLNPSFIFAVDVSDETPKFISDQPIDRLYFKDENSLSALSFLSTMISRPFSALENRLDVIKHIPAFRGNPRRSWDRDSKDEIAKSLQQLSAYEIKKLNSALKLLGWKQDFEVDIDAVSGENRRMPRLTQHAMTKRQKKKQFETLIDVGFGFSQLLPIVQNAVSDEVKLYLVEEPEVHLHPSLQGDLIELIARNSNACADIPIEKLAADSPIGKTHTWFIETHSEYMLRRVQKLIAKGVLESNAVAVYFCDIDESEERVVRQIHLGSKGQMLDPWPNDFIETELDTSGLRLITESTN